MTQAAAPAASGLWRRGVRRRRTVQSTACRHAHRSADRAVVTHTGQQTVQSSPTQVSRPCSRHPHRSADRAVVTHTGQQTVQSSPTQVNRPCSRHPHRSTDRAVVTHTGQQTVQLPRAQVNSTANTSRCCGSSRSCVSPT